MKPFERRRFIQTLVTTSAIAGAGGFSFANAQEKQSMPVIDKTRFKISLNAYSFNNPLTNKKTTLDA